MTRWIIMPLLLGLVTEAALTLSGCSHAPLSDIKAVPGGTRDAVPRDGNGEPMLNAVRPATPLPTATPGSP